jgi:1,4-dihydroxy-2-naphthoyl-CoA hydrolase
LALEQLRERGRRTLIEHIGIELTELGRDFLRGTLRVDHRSCQPQRVLHGGASVVLAESLGSLAANAVAAEPAEKRWVGQEVNANHLRAALEGTLVTGTARAVHLGRSSQVWAIDIVDERGRLVCVSRLTLAAVLPGRDQRGD